jgi:hypothetical protein
MNKLILVFVIGISAIAHSKDGNRFGLAVFGNQTYLTTYLSFGSAGSFELGTSKTMNGYGLNFFYDRSFSNDWSGELGIGGTRRAWGAGGYENTFNSSLAWLMARKWKQNVNGGFGLYYASALGKLKRKDSNGNETEIEFKDFPGNSLNTTDGGLILDLQYAGKFILGLRYLLGAMNFTESSGLRINWTEYQLYLGFAF